MVTAAAAPSPLLAIASAVAQAHWRRRPQNKSRAASPCLRQPACNGARAEQPLWWCRGLLSAQFSPAAAAAPSPLLATASAVAQAHWRRRPQNKSSSSLVIGRCIGVPTGLDCARCYHDGQRSRFGPLLDKVAPPHGTVRWHRTHRMSSKAAGIGLCHWRLCGLIMSARPAHRPLILSYLGRWG